MIARWLTRFLVVTTLLALVGLGSASAYNMGPDRDQVARDATLLIMGATAEDFCEGGAHGAGHDCPLCHKLPGAPQAIAPECPITLALTDGYLLSRDLLHGPANRARDGAPRAPPQGV